MLMHSPFLSLQYSEAICFIIIIDCVLFHFQYPLLFI